MRLSVNKESPDREPVSFQPVEKVWGRWPDACGGIFVALLVFAVLILTINDYGITWDEAAPNFAAAEKQAQWFSRLFTLDNPFSKENIDKYWHSPSTHPSLTRSLMALSCLAFEDLTGHIAAMRLPSAALVSLMSGVFYFWLSRRLNCVVALGSVIALLTLPRMFGHAHIASLDIPMMVWWALTVILFYEGAQRPIISRWHVATGLVYGLALSTKLHSFFLPIPLVLWMLIMRRWMAWRNFLFMAVLGPLVYLLTQVYLWHDFWPRLLERYITYSTKDTLAPVRILYFGQIFADRTPWHYPIMMFLMTMPAVTLFFTILGAAGLYRIDKRNGLRSLILLNIAIPASLITLPHAQGYDGIRLILPAVPWIAILAGLGVDRLVEWLRLIFRYPSRWWNKILMTVGILLLLVPGVSTLSQVHPFHLEYYADWLGGMSGGMRLGMESTYWCDALQPEMLEIMNSRIPDGAKLRPMAMSWEVVKYYQKLGLLKDSIEIGGQPPFGFHLLQCRQGFFGARETELYRGRHGPPLAVTSMDSVPFFMLFGPLKTPG
jgi:4-amino-4-deoxy-L-arabinose transferase-like glycosyltransferase